MRRGNKIFLFSFLVVLIFLIYEFSTLISLLFDDGDAFAIPQEIIIASNEGKPLNKRPFIPKVIHQTYKNTSIPEKWKAGQEACVKLHPDYEYKLWTDESALEFMAEHYPSHLPLFESYPFPIQRADAIRYFILDYYGGIYLDLDDGCARRLDPLLSYPSWLRRTKPTGVSNDAMGSVPGHPFFKQVIDALPRYNRTWGMPYITVMFSTGPLFLSVLWEEYMRCSLGVGEEVMVLMPEEYSGREWSFFDISAGSSWHGKDAKTIFWMGKHWVFLTVSGFVAAGVVGLCLWWMWSTWVMRSRRRRGMGWRKDTGVEI